MKTVLANAAIAVLMLSAVTWADDCNGNGVPDEQDVAEGTSYDCDGDLVPDECELDCDGDGFIDDCESDADLDGDGVPDNCEPDCNGNTIPDDFECEQGWVADCDGDLVPDSCAIESLRVGDCNGNGVPDVCDLADGWDIDQNGIVDGCECLADIAAPDEPGIQDGVVNVDDLLCVLGFWGSEIEAGDVDKDGLVTIDDLLRVLDEWGVCRRRCCVSVPETWSSCQYLYEDECESLDADPVLESSFGEVGTVCEIDSCGLIDVPDGGGVPGGGITVPDGVDVCEYLCQLDKNDPSGWPPEFQTAPPDVIQGIWDILIDGLIDSYGCEPCPSAPTGACCNAAIGACVDDFVEAECTLPGTEWLGAGSTCDDDCD